MKTIKNIIAASVIATLLFTSCSVEKRRYRKGYNVETKSKKPKEEAAKEPVVVKEPAPAEPVVIEEQPKNVEERATTVTTQPPMENKQSVEANGTNNTYSFSVKVGPRPDKKKVQAKHKPKS